ncbi:Sensory transduction protein kinase [Roseomonas mucosa]|uniref:histidine kinase n=1 Tax=Roseomonas mucosa TaxID=207340 RepID=A0A1S8D700_9PROT|nr:MULTISPECIES: HAMP domain-containing sensor histidine kinase [Roseomonas]MBS5903821.1 HAMP domain-containing histidine kinase [Acetobacteraceae bacterium]MCG7351213.1 HAMP domain-containing histidine kinase [Roseomonas mucosa]MCG7357044.1 HAMP domain-containing histidine kinase [Roseomonas mucosa]MDT8288417.1 HAMP domain-containing sensor histidine kinase [Roseomonas mucosa]MDT8294146.1 HAMP domain-containing sensor histidine kinase [Roseomonas mucosa]
MNGIFPPQSASTAAADGQLERELAYYRRECNALGARLLRLQEEQSQAFREARRSRTVAKLIREAYRLADHGNAPEDIGEPMLEIVVDNTICDRAALLQETPRGSQRFRVTHSLGLPPGGPPGHPAVGGGEASPAGQAGHSLVAGEIFVPAPPSFFFTTSRTRLETPAYELTGILRLPYVLWAYDAATGMALIIGNQSESNVSRPFEEADQELIEGALSVYIDVLLRKRSEAELRLAKAQAEEASSTRSRFLATLTHELRTPLNAIIGFSEMMATGSGYEPTAHERGEYNRHILNSAKHLLALINEILDYSSLARGRTTLGRRWLPLNELLKEVTGATAGTAAEREVEVSCDLPEEVWWIRVDRTRFRQILDNLLSNAMRFTAPGGQVVLEARCQEGRGLCLRVRDNGVGIAAEDIPRALEPFRQVGDPFSRSSTGTGLGLPIAKGLAEAHGGSLQIDSVPGIGTTITVLLPADCVAAGGPPQG